MDGLERTQNDFFFLLILDHSHSVLAGNKARMMFLNFLNFYTLFLKFSKSGWVGTDSESNLFFTHSRPFASHSG